MEVAQLTQLAHDLVSFILSTRGFFRCSRRRGQVNRRCIFSVTVLMATFFRCGCRLSKESIRGWVLLGIVSFCSNKVRPHVNLLIREAPVPVLLFQVLVYLNLVGHQSSSGGSGRSLTRSMSPTCSYSFLPRSHLCENIDCRRVHPLCGWRAYIVSMSAAVFKTCFFFAFELMP